VPHYARRVDDNQPDLVAGLRKLGLSVAVTSSLGNGFVDIVVGCGGRNYLFEVKDPAKPPSARTLTQDEQRFHNEWRGQVAVVCTVEDVLSHIYER